MLGTEATPEMLELGKYDVIISALGADPIVPPISGVSGRNVITASDTYGNEDKLAKDVIIIGCGQVGCETGLNLSELGHKVTMLEMQDSVAPDASPTWRNQLSGTWTRTKIPPT